jgi:hypothetical protein
MGDWGLVRKWKSHSKKQEIKPQISQMMKGEGFTACGRIGGYGQNGASKNP